MAGGWLAQAKRRNQFLGTLPYQADGFQSAPRILDLRAAGYLDRLHLDFFIPVVVGGGGALGGTPDLFGSLSGPLQRVTVRANSIGTLFDCSGFMTMVISALDAQYNSGAPIQWIPSPPGYSVTVAQLTAGVTGNFRWTYSVPIALNLANKPWPLGLFQTALNSQETTLEVRFNPINGTANAPGTGLFSGITVANLASANGSLQVHQEYFDPIADPADQPNLAFVHQWREFQFPLSSDGQLEFRLPPSNLYTRMIYSVQTNGVPGLASGTAPVTEAGLNQFVTRVRLMYGANLAPFDQTPQALRQQMEQSYGPMQFRNTSVLNQIAGTYNIPMNAVQFPTGVYIHDFLEASHTERDFINSAATTDLRAVFDITGATYTPNPSILRVAVEQLIPLVPPAAGQAGVQGQAA